MMIDDDFSAKTGDHFHMYNHQINLLLSLPNNTFGTTNSPTPYSGTRPGGFIGERGEALPDCGEEGGILERGGGHLGMR